MKILFLCGLLWLSLWHQSRIQGQVLAGDLGEAGYARHPHQVLFPAVLWAFRLKAAHWWLFYPSAMLVALAGLWDALVSHFRVNRWVATALCWLPLIPGPLTAHIDQRANADVLTTGLLVAVFLWVRWDAARIY